MNKHWTKHKHSNFKAIWFNQPHATGITWKLLLKTVHQIASQNYNLLENLIPWDFPSISSDTGLAILRAPDKVRIFISKIPISSPISMFDHLLESSQRDDSNKWSNIEFGEEIRQVESIEVHFTHLIWSSGEWLHMWRRQQKGTLWRKKYHRPWPDAAHDARRLIRAYDICR